MQGFEFELLYRLQELHNSVLDKIMVVFSTIGNVGLIWIALALFFLFTKKYRKCGAAMALSLIIMVIFGNVILKHIFMRERPCWIDTNVLLLVKNPRDYSFPSGHTYASFAAATSIFIYHKKEGIAAFVVAALIAFSRMYLFLHFPTDIIASVFLGIGTAIIVYIIMKRYYDTVIDKLEKRKRKQVNGKE